MSLYVDAVDDRSHLELSGIVPPMALAALSVRGVVNDLKIPGGTLHLGQEIRFAGPARIGDTINCSAELTQNSVRGGNRVLVIKLCVTGGDCQSIMTGKSTIAIPV